MAELAKVEPAVQDAKMGKSCKVHYSCDKYSAKTELRDIASRKRVAPHNSTTRYLS